MKFQPVSRFVVAIIFSLCIAFPALAQGGPPQGGDSQGGPPQGGPQQGGPMQGNESREKLQHRIEQMMIWELSNAMNLPEEKEEELFDLMRKHFRKRREMSGTQFQVMENLRQLYQDENSDDAMLENALQELEESYEQQIELEKELLKNLKKVLDVREQARFVLEWPQVQRRVREAVEQHRRKQGRDKGQGKHNDNQRGNRGQPE